MKTYTELLEFPSFQERLEYLRVTEPHATSLTSFYKTTQWLFVRDQIRKRDLGSDMGLLDFPISTRQLVHHINPITQQDIDDWDEEKLFSTENLILVSVETHNTIHYGNAQVPIASRKKGDNLPW